MAADLKGRVALVTGGARGQGAAHARRLAAAGASVVITDVLDTEGAALAREIGAQAHYEHHDVSSAQDWERVTGETLSRFERLDVLVNNAGIWRSLTLEETSVEAFEQVVRVNQLGTFLGMKSALAPMRAAGGGSIINIASFFAVRPWAGSLAYSGSKWAVRGMSKVAALELAAHKIRVNVVFPGIIRTPMLDENTDEVNKSLPDIPPLKRLGEAEDVAELVHFLASDASAYITGAEISCDGAVSL